VGRSESQKLAGHMAKLATKLILPFKVHKTLGFTTEAQNRTFDFFRVQSRHQIPYFLHRRSLFTGFQPKPFTQNLTQSLQPSFMCSCLKQLPPSNKFAIVMLLGWLPLSRQGKNIQH